MRGDHKNEPTGVVLRRGSGLPVYLQVVDQFRYLISAGRFRVGDYLPPMRQVADELGLNLNTVLRAYSELQRDGLIESTRGKGAVVVRVQSESTSYRQRTSGNPPETIDAMISAAVEHALAAGLEASEVLARTQAALDSVGERTPSGPVIGILAAPLWRARALADTLRIAGIGRVRALTNREEPTGCDLLIRPLFGPAAHDDVTVGAPTLDVALLLDRTCIREILEIEPLSSVAVVAGDELVATWLADAVTGYSRAATVVRIVADSLGEVDMSTVTIAVVERGMPRGAVTGTMPRLITAGAVFPASISENISARLSV